LRRLVPEVVIRTTMIVGFPGETSEAFQNLLRGVREVRFERLGAFAFSPEEGTPAAALPGAVPPATARRRLGRLMREQARVSAALQARQIGRTLRVLIESVAPDRREARGRSYREAPEVDGEVIVRLAPRKATRAVARGRKRLSIGDFVEVRITEADTHDLYGEAV
jgi:ribosomal protein S12 methylthiotransferase